MPGIVTMSDIDQKRNQCNYLIDRKRNLEPEHGMQCPFYLKIIKGIADFQDEIEKMLAQYHQQESLTTEKLKEYFPQLDLERLPEGYLATQIEFANENTKRRDSLLDCLRTITRNGTDTAMLFKDHASHSFTFNNPRFNGGIIFHPDGSGPGHEAPILSVTLDDTRDVWQCHT